MGSTAAQGSPRGSATAVRAAAAGIGSDLGCHSCRATGITSYLVHGGTLERAAAIAGHASTRTTRKYAPSVPARGSSRRSVWPLAQYPVFENGCRQVEAATARGVARRSRSANRAAAARR
jgi:integrase